MTKKKTPDPKPTPAERPMAIDKSERLVHHDAPIILGTGHAERDVVLCPVCGGSRAGMKATDPCLVDGHQLEDS